MFRKKILWLMDSLSNEYDMFKSMFSKLSKDKIYQDIEKLEIFLYTYSNDKQKMYLSLIFKYCVNICLSYIVNCIGGKFMPNLVCVTDEVAEEMQSCFTDCGPVDGCNPDD